MTDNTARRRGHGEDAIYFDAAKNRYVGAISVGFGPDGKRIRRKVSGRTKAEVRDKLKAAHNELDRGLHTSATYTVRHAVDDWLEGGLQGRSERTRSIYREALKPLLEHIGTRPLRELTARDVRRGLEALSERMSTRCLQLARASLARAIRYAEAHDLVGRNVATFEASCLARRQGVVALGLYTHSIGTGGGGRVSSWQHQETAGQRTDLPTLALGWFFTRGLLSGASRIE